MNRRVLIVFSILAVALTFSACTRETSQQSRVIVLALDGVDPHTVDLLMSEGKLPNFARMKNEGAYGTLLSQKPLLSPVVWTTIATGKTPDQHRIGHFVAINPQTGEELPVTSQMRRVKAIWNILSEQGRTVASAGWWATWPAETVNGAIVSDHVAYHFMFDEGLRERTQTVGLTHPPALYDEIAPLIVRPVDIGADDVPRFLDVPTETLDRPFDFNDPVAHFRWALATSETYKNIGLHLWKTIEPDNLLVYIEGVDSTSHLFGHVFRNESLAGELAEQKAMYGRAVEAMYIRIDEIVGEFIDAMDDDTTLLVLSDHGFELGVVPEDPSMTRDFRRVSDKYHRLRGILYMYGNHVRRGSIDRPTILDIAPTVLALNGVPPAVDMPGRVLSGSLEMTESERHPSYESGSTETPAQLAESPAVDKEVLEKLRSLGYLGATSPTGDASLAMILFEQQRFEEAAVAFEEILATTPDNPEVLTSYAATLGQLGRYDEAIRMIDEALRLRPLSPEAYHNRAVVYERQGKRDEAIADYRAAVKYANFAPSREALKRLGAQPSSVQDSSGTAAEAIALTKEAEAAAKRGDYPGAVALLDRAEALAPELPLIHQYRSNVAYLMGDVDGAIRALERGLEIEPDNVLFKENLKTLRAKRAQAK